VTEHYDVIIVGSGAGGGTLAHTLAPSGKRILLLERGDFLPRETDNWDPGSVFVDSIGAVNPARTAMANAIRVGEHLLGRMS
jgi:2-polyprenyl-6-methoxyphenol hydroxylase-like FAD-dependent oxidoreductase